MRISRSVLAGLFVKILADTRNIQGSVCITGGYLDILSGFDIDVKDRFIIRGKACGDLTVSLLFLLCLFGDPLFFLLYIFFDKYVYQAVCDKTSDRVKRRKGVEYLQKYKKRHHAARCTDSEIMDPPGSLRSDRRKEGIHGDQYEQY